MDAVQYGFGAVTTAIFHPLGYAKVLIQIGHEPLDPFLSKTLIWRQPQYYYPSVFQYISHIKKRDGFLGLYRGLVPRLVGGIVGNVVTKSTAEYLKKKFPEKTSEDEDANEIVKFVSKFWKDVSQEVLARTLALVCSQPFQVIAIRSMAQFIGQETAYSSIFSAITEIYVHEGFLGYFAGIVPRWIGDTVGIVIIHLLTEILNKYIIQDDEYKSFTSGSCSLIVSIFTYPFQLVSTIMTVNGSNLAAASSPHMLYYPSWTECWTHLSKMGQLKRGSSMMWRAVKDPYVLRRQPPPQFAF